MKFRIRNTLYMHKVRSEPKYLQKYMAKRSAQEDIKVVGRHTFQNLKSQGICHLFQMAVKKTGRIICLACQLIIACLQSNNKYGDYPRRTALSGEYGYTIHKFNKYGYLTMNIVNWTPLIYPNKSWLSVSIYIMDIYTRKMDADEDSVKFIWNYLQYEGATKNIFDVTLFSISDARYE